MIFHLPRLQKYIKTFSGIFSLILIVGCSDPRSVFEKDNIKAQIGNQYDSIKFYDDADWITLKGKNELTEDELAYPFLCFLFKKDITEGLFFIKKDRMIRWHFKKRDDILFTELKHFDKEARDTIHRYILFYSGYQLNIGCFNRDLFSDKSINVSYIIKTTKIDSATFSQQIYRPTYGTRPVELKELLSFDSLKSSSALSSYSEETLQIRDDSLYQTNNFKLEEGKRTNYHSEVSELAGAWERSFLFFYVNVYRKWIPVQ